MSAKFVLPSYDPILKKKKKKNPSPHAMFEGKVFRQYFIVQ